MSTIDDVKQRLDIVDVIGGYVELNKAGRNFKAACPFHQEKTPSFFVFPDRQTWKCFGCDAGGDLLSFVMKREGIDFGEALKVLADRAGVPLIRTESKVEDKRTGGLFQVNSIAAQYYHDLLLRAPQAEAARNYVKKRGLKLHTVIDFQMGFSSGEGLGKHLLEKGYKEEELINIGLVRQKDDHTYELFHNRLIFPIKDIKGRVVGFGARALDDSLPKYLNSPQSGIFDKSSILYGIDRAGRDIRDKNSVIMVEGYTDVIAAHQYGTTNVVASMGTALTEKQIRVLKNLTRSFTFALDPDAAGDAATLRGIDVARGSLDRENLKAPNLLGAMSKLKAEMKIISLPSGKDPDTLIRENPELWQQLIQKAIPLVDHLISVVSSRYDLSKPEGKTKAIEQLLPMVAELDDEIQREYYLTKLATVLNVSEKTLLDEAARIHSPKKIKPRKVEQRVRTKYGDPVEEYCLSMLLQHPELREKAEGLAIEHFERSENREVFTAWSDTLDFPDLMDAVNDDLREHTEALAGRKLPPAEEQDWENALTTCINRLEERRLRAQEEYLSSEVMYMIKDGAELDPVELDALQKQPIDINERLVTKMRERTEHHIK